MRDNVGGIPGRVSSHRLGDWFISDSDVALNVILNDNDNGVDGSRAVIDTLVSRR